MKIRASCLVLLCALGACSSGVPDNPGAGDAGVAGNRAQVTGTLMYRERIVLPPGIVAEVWLLDTSLADASAAEIAYQKINDPGNPPIPFVLEYDPQVISDNRQYSVRATIRHDGQLLFTSDTHYPVLTRGAGNSADIMLVMIDRDR
jgi:putative lipoprotein